MLEAFTNKEVQTAKQVLTLCSRRGFTMEQSLAHIEKNIRRAIQTVPCPECGNAMTNRSADGLYLWMCAECRYSEVEK